jgi:hypothetical protein
LARFQTGYPALEREGVAVVGVGMFGRRAKERLRMYRDRNGLTFPLVYDGPPDGYGAWGSPSVAILNPRGELVGFRRGGEGHWDSPAFRALVARLAPTPAGASPTTSTGSDQAP